MRALAARLSGLPGAAAGARSRRRSGQDARCEPSDGMAIAGICVHDGQPAVAHRVIKRDRPTEMPHADRQRHRAATADRRRQRRGRPKPSSAPAQRRHRGAPAAPGERGELARQLGAAAARPGAGRARLRTTVPLGQGRAGASTPAARTSRCCCWSTRIDEAGLLQATGRSARAASRCAAAPTTCRHACAPNGPTWRRAARCAGSKRQVRETERRCDALIDSSRDPIAYVHEGMHIRANDGLPGDVRLRVLRGHRGHVAARPDRAAARRRLQAAAQAAVARASRRRRATSSRRARWTATASRR